MVQPKREVPISLISHSTEYIPSEEEKYMNSQQLEYFRRKLEAWRTELMNESVETIHHMKKETHNESDITDRASTETDRAFELISRDRVFKLINKINEALKRIQGGGYGFCEETGEPIGLARLEARPIATLSLDSQERHERSERAYREA